MTLIPPDGVPSRVGGRGSVSQRVLTINAGSSSVKFAIFDVDAEPQRRLRGVMNRPGSPDSTISFSLPPDGARHHDQPSICVRGAPAQFLVDWIQSRPEFESIGAVGHRVVHGMHHSDPAVVTPELLGELRRLQPFDPEHLPLEIDLIDAFRRRHPQLPQLLCFDTAFHHDMPRVATLLPVPRRLEQAGVRRYGFHGLSYTYLMDELSRLDEPAVHRGRLILAHLGSGASMAAVQDGRGIDTSMGFTPASGLPMSTRSGDLDPGLFSFLARTEQMTAARFDRMANHESGLLGVSQTSADVRELLELESRDTRAAEALALFCYQAKKLVGAYAAAMGGLDALVFTGGIGENAPLIRERICAGLGFLGICIDPHRNSRNAALISSDAARVRVRVIPTDEELIIARACASRFVAA